LPFTFACGSARYSPRLPASQTKPARCIAFE
jgi:hypothetical protein